MCKADRSKFQLICAADLNSWFVKLICTVGWSDFERTKLVTCRAVLIVLLDIKNSFLLSPKKGQILFFSQFLAFSRVPAFSFQKSLHPSYTVEAVNLFTRGMRRGLEDIRRKINSTRTSIL